MKKTQCECSNTACAYHTGQLTHGACTEEGTTVLYRIDMVDVTGTRFCDGCADDAFNSGLFATEPNRYSQV